MKYNGPIAVIDVGSHFARLEIVQIIDDGNSFELLESLTQVIPLGLDVFTKGRISSGNMILVGKVLKDFYRVLREYKIKHYKGVATSAVREAANSEIFIDRVKRISGIELKVLEPAEEARIMFLTLEKNIGDQFSFREKNSMVCSIGTGNTRVSFIEKGMLKSTEAVRIGSLRLVEELEKPMSARQLKVAIKPFVDTEAKAVLSQSTIDLNDILVIGMGSSVRAFLKFNDKINPGKESQVLTLSKKEFQEIYGIVSELSPSDIANKYNLSDTLAQCIEPSCCILFHFFNETNADKIIIPLMSTRDALIYDFINEIGNVEDPFTPQLFSCVRALGDRYKYDSKHAESVAKAAVAIFDKTSYLHGLNSKKNRELLQISALLHDIGLYVNTRKHHKHSYYLIKNSQVPGLLSEDINIVATIARYHRRAFPKNSHLEYSTLSSKNKVLVSSLSAILRIADALEFTQGSDITHIKVNHRKQNIEIILDGDVDLTLESWTIRNKANLFKEIFGYKVRLTGK